MNNFAIRYRISELDEDIIKVDCDFTLDNEISEDIIHQSLEYNWTVIESKIHNTEFEESAIGDESGFLFVSFFNLDVIVTLMDVRFNEDVCSLTKILALSHYCCSIRLALR